MILIKRIVFFLILLISSCFSYTYISNEESFHNSSFHTLRSEYDGKLMTFENEIKSLIDEVDWMMCISLSGGMFMREKFKQQLDKSKYSGIVNTSANEFSSVDNVRILKESVFKKHIKGDGEDNYEAVDGGKGSKKQKVPETKSAVAEEEGGEALAKMEDTPSVPLPPPPPPPPPTDAPPEAPPVEVKPKKAFQDVGLDYYDSNDDEDDDDDDAREKMCNWQNYLDKYRWLHKRDDDEDDRPPSYGPQVTVDQLNLGRLSTKKSIKTNSEKKSQDTSKNTKSAASGEILELITRAARRIENCMQCSVTAVSKQVLYRVGMLLTETEWSDEMGNKLALLFKRILDSNKMLANDSNEVVAQLLETFPASKIRHTVAPMLNSHLPLAFSNSIQSYIQ